MRSLSMILILMVMLFEIPVAAKADAPVCEQNEQVTAVIANGYVAFVYSMPAIAGAKPWPSERIDAVASSYAEAIEHGYAGPGAFGSLKAWASAFGLARAPAGCPGSNCCGAGGALRLVYVPNAIQAAAWVQLPDGRRVAAIQTGCGEDGCSLDGVYHELAHIWDLHRDGALGTQLDAAMGVVRDGAGRVDIEYYYGRKVPEGTAAEPAPTRVHGDFPTAYFNRMHPSLPAGCEHFAETVMADFLMDQGQRYGFAACWTDEDPRCGPGRRYDYDRGDFVRDLIGKVQTWRPEFTDEVLGRGFSVLLRAIA